MEKLLFCINLELLVKMFYFIELLRPFTLIAPFTGIFSGALAAIGAAGISIQPHVIYTILFAAISAVLLNGASNAFNQVCDIEVDRINKPERPLPSGRLKKKEAEKFAAVVYLVALVLAAIVNTTFFMLVAVAALLTILYSWHPIRLKNYGWIANATIGISRGLLLIVAGWSVVEFPSSAAPWFTGSVFGIFLLGAASTKDFPDIKGDMKYGTRTLPVIYGVEKSARIISVFLVFPFLLFPLGVFAGILPQGAMYLTLLSLWGAYAAYLMLNNPRKMVWGTNLYQSWVHMYLIMTAGCIAFAGAYWI